MSDEKKQQPVLSKVEQYKRDRAASDIEAIHKALVIDAPVIRIPEATFLKEILPILTGEAISADFPLLMASVAGSPFSELDIVDEAGNILFRLPAALERDIISHKEAEKRGSLDSSMITASMLIKQNPRRAESFFEHTFKGRGIALNADAVRNTRQERFVAILARYGKTPGGAKAKGVSTISKNPELTHSDDDLL